jgi:branched-chain amino acid transport system ATP-binding protein
MSALLEVHDLHSGYGSSQVLFGISLSIEAGGVSTLLGRNGMGKTTTVRSILGLTPVLAGTVRFCGERVEGYSPDRIARMGLAVVPEGRQIFPTLSVQENLLAFAANRNSSANPWTLERVYALFPRLAERHRHMGNQLSGGEQQMLAIGRALMTNPHLLVLDEATEGWCAKTFGVVCTPCVVKAKAFWSSTSMCKSWSSWPTSTPSSNVGVWCGRARLRR